MLYRIILKKFYSKQLHTIFNLSENQKLKIPRTTSLYEIQTLIYRQAKFKRFGNNIFEPFFTALLFGTQKGLKKSEKIC